MRTHVALLRGVNVGGRNLLSMAALRDVVAALGYGHIATYVQSGNVVFAAPDPSVAHDALADALAAAIARELEVRPSVVVVPRGELADVVAANPLPVDDPKQLHAVFFPEPLDAARADAVAPAVQRARAQGSRDDARVVGRVLYLSTPEGFGRSVLRAQLDRGGKQSPMRDGTARNFSTVHALVSLLGG